MRAVSVKLHRGNIGIWLVGSVVLLIVGIAIAAYDLWYQAAFYVSTDYAQVVGATTLVVSPGAARVMLLQVEPGSEVAPNQSVATLRLAGSASDGGDQEMTAEKGGTILEVYAREGQLTFAGQPLLALAEPTDLWIVADVSEDDLGSVEVGQVAEVQLVLLDRNITGRVTEILSEAERVPAPAGVAASARTVPVRIEPDGEVEGLLPGMAAYVRIRVH